ncbi:MAG: TfuA-related McrA-glycine thioamidation protein [Methanomicrobiaceae archaeon]|nr:TfuA-related McrA-glycine thioamidation protein [Methanomicrobiaceae archaeon]
MPHVVVFLGPSLDQGEARQILKARYLPPARRGDLSAAAAEGATVIGLIDGVFFQDSAVGHREILGALRSGIRVIGASSMGALRAAEMADFGMEGVGEVFRMYRDGELVSDDEVALVFDPFTLTPLSEPMVNIRYALRCARDAGTLSREEAEAIFSCATRLYYPDRTYPRICREAAEELGEGPVLRFSAFLKERSPDLKREDAIAALRYISQTL